MSNEEIAARLYYYQDKKKKVWVIGICVIIGIAILSFATASWSEGALTFPIIFMSGMVAFVIIAIISGRYDAKCKECSSVLVSNVLNEHFENVVYDYRGSISRDFVRNINMGLSSFNRISGNDYISGEYKGMRFEMSDMTLKYETGSGKNRRVREIFRGTWLICYCNKGLKGDVLVYPRKMAAGKLANIFGEGSDVETENMEFNNEFVIKSNYDYDAFYILTPHMMERILEAQNVAQGGVHMRCIKTGAVVMAINSKRNLFEMNGEINLNKLREKFTAEVRYIISIMDELRLADNA